MIELACAGRVVARYDEAPALPRTVSPRPYLHPVTTLSGVEVTELMPADHAHHLGVCVAVPDVGGHNFWGGRTFVRDRGPTWLDDHGEQRHLGWERRGPDGFTESLAWYHETTILTETRTVAVRPAGEGWVLDLSFALTNRTGAALAIGSPATNGRPGAGYGGFFWRAPGTSTGIRVATPDEAGEDLVHGSTARWLMFGGTAADGRPWTLVFVRAGPADPWFVRAREYPGVGSSLAWDRPLTLGPGGVLRRRLLTVVHDGALTLARAASLAEEAIPPTERGRQ